MALRYPAGMILEQLRVSADEFERGTGWAVRPEGACHGEICVPLPTAARDDDPTTVDVRPVAERLGMPLVRDERAGLWALGPASLGGTVLASAQAPELTLPDLDGDETSLSSLRGQKVVLVGWTPY